MADIDSTPPAAPTAESDSARSITKAAGAPTPPARKESATHRHAEMRHDPEAIRRAFETSQFPYETRLTEKEYLTRVRPLQIELLKAQNWIKESGEKVVLLFEGRDAAGKGGASHPALDAAAKDALSELANVNI